MAAAAEDVKHRRSAAISSSSRSATSSQKLNMAELSKWARRKLQTPGEALQKTGTRWPYPGSPIEAGRTAPSRMARSHFTRSP